MLLHNYSWNGYTIIHLTISLLLDTHVVFCFSFKKIKFIEVTLANNITYISSVQHYNMFSVLQDE